MHFAPIRSSSRVRCVGSGAGRLVRHVRGIVIGLLPEHLARCIAEVGAVRARLQTDTALRVLRTLTVARLPALPVPLGNYIQCYPNSLTDEDYVEKCRNPGKAPRWPAGAVRDCNGEIRVYYGEPAPSTAPRVTASTGRLSTSASLKPRNTPINKNTTMVVAATTGETARTMKNEFSNGAHWSISHRINHSKLTKSPRATVASAKAIQRSQSFCLSD